MVRVPVTQGPQESLNPISGFQPQSTYVRAPNPLGALIEPVNQVNTVNNHTDNLRVEDMFNRARVIQAGLQDEARQQLGANVLPKDGESFTGLYTKRFSEEASKLEAELTNGGQKALFRQRVGHLGEVFRLSVDSHEKAQLKSYADDVDKSTIAVEAQSAYKNAGNSNELVMGQMRVGGAVASLAKRNGWDADTTAIEKQKALTEFHGQVLGAALDGGKVDYAKSYLEQHGEELSPKAREVVGLAIQKKEAELITDTAASTIWSQFGPKSDTDPVSMDVMMAEVRKTYADKPELKKEIERQIKDMASEHDYSVRQRENATVSGFFKAIEGGASWKQIKADPAYMGLDGKTQDGLRKHFESERGITKGEGTPANAPSEYWNLVDNPDKLKAMTVDEIVAMTPRIGKSYREALLQRRAALQTPKREAEIKVDQDILNTEYRAAMNLKPERKLTEEDKTVLTELEVAVKKAQEASGVAWSLDNTQKLVRQMLKPVVTKRGFFGKTESPMFKAAGQVPLEYVSLVRRKAPNATDDQIVQAYFMDKDKGLVD